MNFIDRALARRENLTPDCVNEAVDAEMEILSQKIALNQDYNAFWDLVRGYIERSGK